MLGVRLDSDLEERLAAVARTQGRSKSDIAREAVRRYVERHDEAYLAEARRQSLRAAELDRTNPELADDWNFIEAVESRDASWR